MPNFINIISVVIKLVCVGRYDEAKDEIFFIDSSLENRRYLCLVYRFRH